jgi:hypothetical protein
MLGVENVLVIVVQGLKRWAQALKIRDKSSHIHVLKLNLRFAVSAYFLSLVL